MTDFQAARFLGFAGSGLISIAVNRAVVPAETVTEPLIVNFTAFVRDP